MAVELDHFMVPARDKLASAKLLAELLDVPWSGQGVGPFAPVFVNDGFTIDFDEWSDPFRSNVQGPVDYQVNTQHGGRIVYWNEPDGHYWEMLTQSYARKP